MRILFVNTVDCKNKIESLFAPLGLGYLAAYLREKLPTLEMKIVQDDIEGHLQRFKPDLVGLSSVTQSFGLARQYARLVKAYNVPVVIGGTHISALPSSLSLEMDLGVVGEGEETMVQLIQTIQNYGFDFEKIKNIKGLVYFDKAGSLVFTSYRNPIEPLDKLPFPARDLLGIKKRERCYIFSSRGCPYRCIFCASSRFWPKIRSFSPSYVVREVKEILEHYRPNQITFYDDLFVFSKKRLKEIVRLIREEKINRKVEFAVSARANLIDEEVAGLLKQMNVVSVSMGLESGAGASLAFLKPRVTVEQNKRTVEILDRMGFAVNASFIIGSPSERKEEILETFRFIEEGPFNHVYVYMLTPYPGTPVWDYAYQRGLVSEDMDWNRLSLGVENSSNYIHLSEVLPREELYELYKKFQALAKRKRISALVRQAYRNPRRIVPYLVRKAVSV